jgi:hypothetical protein
LYRGDIRRFCGLQVYGALRLNLALPPAGNAHVGRLTSIPRMAKMYFENNRFSERENDVIKLLVQGKVISKLPLNSEFLTEQWNFTLAIFTQN